jgi:general secretion pathway protein L
MRWRIDSGMIGAWSHDLRRAARAAIEWWLAGLLEPLPSHWRRRLLGRFGRVLLEQCGGEWSAGWVADLSLPEAKTTVSLSVDDSFEAARAALGSSATAPAVLVLGKDVVLHRRLSLPSAAGAVLKNVVRNEIERLTPIPKNDLAFQYRVARHDRVQKRVLIDTFITRASVVDALVGRWVDRGWSIGAVTIRRGERVELGLDFSTGRKCSPARRFAVPLPRWSMVAAAAAGIVALYAPSWYYASLRDAHAAELAELRTAALAARDTLSRRDESLNRDRFLGHQRASRAPALAAFSELTSILPDDTWLQEAHLRRGEMQIQGDSASASTVVQLLEQSPVFEEAKFTAPISSAGSDARERFVINFRLATRQPP